ncbi:MAG: hypothetical protein KGL03_06025 [Nitrospirota bacterium]|nr:hypothetical protein [Nitrospirota bacterium]
MLHGEEPVMEAIKVGDGVSGQSPDFRGWLVPGLLVTVILLAMGLAFGRGLLQGERDAYERGVAMTVLHQQCRGSVPTPEYVDRAFAWGDPKSCADLQRIEEPRRP